MSFEVAADAYGRFMGRFSDGLSAGLADLAEVRSGQRVLDVGAGPGTLSAELARRVGEAHVAAIDPSPPFVSALRDRLPGADVRRGTAEDLPHPDDTFDATLAQLVVHFMSDPVGGIREMARVTVPGGVVAACVWDHAGGRSPLSTCWNAVSALDPDAVDEGGLPGVRAGHLGQLFGTAGLADVEESELAVASSFASFEEWWEPYGFGIGPLGEYVARLDDAARERLRARCAAALGPAPFTVRATAWAVRARA
jgi:SAM-dependent methyltransferase